jgi:hypothetical protein
MKSLRIMTTVHLANHGACIFVDALYRTLVRNLPGYDIRTLDYLPRNWLYHEWLRALKPQPKSLTFNLRRFLQSEKFQRDHLHLDKPTPFYPVGYEGMVHFLAEQRYDAIVVGMVIWDITELPQIPRFPNAYWLSEKIPSTKIAYAASGHRSRAPLIQKNLPRIRKILSSYRLIGVRDQITWEMVLDSKVHQEVPVVRVPDPSFLYEHRATRAGEILEAHGIDLDRPVLGVLFYGKPDLSQELCRFYRSKGYQTVALSLYNPHADVNLGHILTPYEWADAFKYLTFCVTDRFHGTIFCLKNNIPFISIEPYAPEGIKKTKIFSLLDEFNLTECYMDVLEPDFKMREFLEHAEDLREMWRKNFRQLVSGKLEEMENRSMKFVDQVKALLA